MREQQTLKEWLNSRITVSVVSALDTHMKRIVAVASLYGCLLDQKARNKDIETRLSKVMNLTSNANSLTLPMVYHRAIWRNVEREHADTFQKIKQHFSQPAPVELSGEQAEKFAAILVTLMPTYLRYDTCDIIRRDCVSMLEAMPFILGSANASQA